MAQDDAYALYFAKNYAAGKKRAGGEKRCLEQPLGFVTDIYIYTKSKSKNLKTIFSE